MIASLPFASDVDKRHIAELVTTLDNANLLTIGLKVPALVQIGKKIDVHPFAFIHAVMTDSDLRIRMKRVFDSAIKWRGFLYGSGFNEGFSHKLEREYKKANLEPHVDWLAHQLGVDAEEIRPLTQRRAWYDLFVRLCEKTGARLEQTSQE